MLRHSESGFTRVSDDLKDEGDGDTNVIHS